MPIFITVIVLVIILNIFLLRSSKIKKPFEKFLEDERRANTARKGEIPEEYAITANKDALPFHDYDNDNTHVTSLIRTRDNVLARIDKPMLRLPPGMGNNDIKLAYGISNFDIVTSREENYNTFIRSLVNWSLELIKCNMNEDAEAVLNESVRMKSDLSLSYTLLCDIYERSGNKSKLNELKQIVMQEDFMAHNKATRDKIRNRFK